MLKIEHIPQTVNSSPNLICCFDVSKRSLSLYSEYRTKPPSGAATCRIEDETPNQTAVIERLLERLQRLAEEVDLDGLVVLR